MEQIPAEQRASGEQVLANLLGPERLYCVQRLIDLAGLVDDYAGACDNGMRDTESGDEAEKLRECGVAARSPSQRILTRALPRLIALQWWYSGAAQSLWRRHSATQAGEESYIAMGQRLAAQERDAVMGIVNRMLVSGIDPDSIDDADGEDTIFAFLSGGALDEASIFAMLIEGVTIAEAYGKACGESAGEIDQALQVSTRQSYKLLKLWKSRSWVFNLRIVTLELDANRDILKSGGRRSYDFPADVAACW